MNRVKLALILCIFTIVFLKRERVGCVEVRSANGISMTSQRLSGNEVLLDIIDYSGKMTSGIYVLPVSETNSISAHYLLIPYGSHPKWSWHHKKFTYYFNGEIWISDLEGNKTSLFPFPTDTFTKGYSDVINWSMDGRLLFTVHSVEWGSKVLAGPSVEDVPISTIKKKHSLLFSSGWGIFPIIPLEKPTETGISEFGGDISWSNMMTTANASVSPDGARAVMEVYPSSPMDIQRRNSKLLVYDFYKNNEISAGDPRMEEYSKYFYSGLVIPPLRGKGKRITTSNDNIAELKPLWSPDGKWIAYTEVDFSRGCIMPKIISIDKKNTTPIITGRRESWGNFAPQNGWDMIQPISAVKWLKNIENQATGIKSWGNPHRMAEEWSQDGKYIWMTRGNDGIYVAKYENGQWSMRQVAESAGSEFGFESVAFNDDRVAWVEDSGDRRKILEIFITDVNSQNNQSFRLPHAVHVNSLDW